MPSHLGPKPLRIEREHSLVVVIDIQERLAARIEHRDRIIANTVALLRAAERFDIPRRLTEHCPSQIGASVPEIRERFTDAEVFGKVRFGAADDPAFGRMLRATGRSRVLLTGMEAHVCVMQTALALMTEGFQVVVVADAVGSRQGKALEVGWSFDRMRDAGVVIAGTETVLFEWTGGADDPAFRDILGIVKAMS